MLRLPKSNCSAIFAADSCLSERSKFTIFSVCLLIHNPEFSPFYLRLFSVSSPNFFSDSIMEKKQRKNIQNWQLKLAKDFIPNYIRIVQGMLSIAFDRAFVLGIAKKILLV